MIRIVMVAMSACAMLLSCAPDAVQTRSMERINVGARSLKAEVTLPDGGVISANYALVPSRTPDLRISADGSDPRNMRILHHFKNEENHERETDITGHFITTQEGLRAFDQQYAFVYGPNRLVVMEGKNIVGESVFFCFDNNASIGCAFPDNIAVHPKNGLRYCRGRINVLFRATTTVADMSHFLEENKIVPVGMHFLSSCLIVGELAATDDVFAIADRLATDPRVQTALPVYVIDVDLPAR